MKKLLPLFLLLFCLSACDKDDSETDIEKGIFIATIDGELLDFSEGGAILDATSTFQLFTISGSPEGNSLFSNVLRITFKLPALAVIEEKSYEFIDTTCDESEEVCAAIFYLESTGEESAGYGAYFEGSNASITFRTLDYKVGGKAIGIFSGILFDDSGNEVQVENGQFNLIIK